MFLCKILLCSFTKKKTGNVFPVFCHATFHHALITCCNVNTIGIHLTIIPLALMDSESIAHEAATPNGLLTQRP